MHKIGLQTSLRKEFIHNPTPDSSYLNNAFINMYIENNYLESDFKVLILIFLILV